MFEQQDMKWNEWKEYDRRIYVEKSTFFMIYSEVKIDQKYFNCWLSNKFFST